MNRRAFLLGAIAAPVIAPVVAKAAAPKVVGWDLASGPDVTARVLMTVGERGSEMVIPTTRAAMLRIVSLAPGAYATKTLSIDGVRVRDWSEVVFDSDV